MSANASDRKTLLTMLEKESITIRRNIWRALRSAGSGHVGGSTSAADLLAALYFYHLNIRPKEPNWKNRDRFVLSKGHANAALAAVLAQAGFFSEELLDDFYGYKSLMGMHPDIKLAGVEMSTGGLGHGLSIGVGMALGQRMQNINANTVVMLGDGELQEGSNWEAAMAASQLKLRNLSAIIDYNKIQQSGNVNEIMNLEPLLGKWSSFGWAVRELNGHNMVEIVEALDAIPYASDKPSLMLAHTIKGKGVSFTEGTHLWHQNAIDEDSYQKAMSELGQPS